MRRAAAVTLAALAALAAALAIGGPFALVVTAECLAVLALVVALARTPAGVRDRGAPRAAAWARATLARLRARRHPRAEVSSGDFPAYSKISSDLGWASVSRWHYDHGIRPLFGRLLESVLAERHRVDLARDPARARDLVGEDIWPLRSEERRVGKECRSRWWLSK